MTALDWIIAIVPMAAGLGVLLSVCSAILKHGKTPANATFLVGVGALLCVAPTVLNLSLKLPGGGELSLLKQQFKEDLGDQGAGLKREIADLRQQVAKVAGPVGVASSTASPASSAPSAAQRVVIFYAQDRKDQAQKLESFLIQKGYAANSVYTDFSELKDDRRGPAGSTRVVFTTRTKSAADKLIDDLHTLVPNPAREQNDNLNVADLQVRMF
jgi:hypothetical protein